MVAPLALSNASASFCGKECQEVLFIFYFSTQLIETLLYLLEHCTKARISDLLRCHLEIWICWLQALNVIPCTGLYGSKILIYFPFFLLSSAPWSSAEDYWDQTWAGRRLLLVSHTKNRPGIGHHSPWISSKSGMQFKVGCCAGCHGWVLFAHCWQEEWDKFDSQCSL